MVANIMDWQPRRYAEIVEETPYVPLVMILDTIVDRNKERREEMGLNKPSSGGERQQLDAYSSRGAISSLAGSVLERNKTVNQF